MNSHLLTLVIVPLILFGLPSCFLILRLWLNRKTVSGKSDWTDIPFQAAVLFLVVYGIRTALIVLLSIKPAITWPIGWIVIWPVIGILLALCGLVMVSRAREGEKGLLVVANMLFLALSLFSIIAPN
jgi:cytochrome bd-type quinol oxidase subunit 2